jgi:hypothetical protein
VHQGDLVVGLDQLVALGLVDVAEATHAERFELDGRSAPMLEQPTTWTPRSSRTSSFLVLTLGQDRFR